MKVLLGFLLCFVVIIGASVGFVAATYDHSKDVYCNGCNDIGKSNIELGWNGDHNGDLAAVGHLSICWDLCHGGGWALYDGYHHQLLMMVPGGRHRRGHLICPAPCALDIRR